MKCGKAMCLAIGIFVGASVIAAARAQDRDDRGSHGQDASRQPQNQALQFLSKYQSNQQTGASDKPGSKSGNILSGDRDGQTWSYVVPMGAQGWWQSAASPQELNLTAADDSVREHLHLPKGQGIVVNEVAPNSGAAQVGLQPNDILLMLADTPLAKPEDLYNGLKQAAEKPVSLTLLRSGSRVTLQVQPLIRVSLRPVAAPSPAREYWIGITLTPLEPVLRAQLRLSPNHKAVVNEVFAGSPAANAGIARHDIIVALDGKPISELSDVAKSVQANGEKPLSLKVIGKDGKPRLITVTPERKKGTEKPGDMHSWVVPNLNTNFNPLAFPNSNVTYDVVHPGFVLNYTNTGNLLNPAGNPNLGQLPVYPALGSKPADAAQALTGRLDALDAELKELRALVQSLQAAAAKIIEREKAASGSPTTEKDQPK
jgi:membrane-associated protease RseP (regulator of RpoE activity)